MAKPRKHKFIIEITDMSHGLSSREMRSIIALALERGFQMLRHDSSFSNIQVKEFSRVMARYRQAKTRSPF